MEFRTKVGLPDNIRKIEHSDVVILFGSCFAENIGKRLNDSKIRCDLNPFGILYNPLSISTAIKEIINEKQYNGKDIFFANEQWHSWMHHSLFSQSDKGKCLKYINDRISLANEHIKAARYFVFTWGSAFVYSLKENGHVVGNCHKQKDFLFERRLITVDEIVSEYKLLIENIKKINPNIDFLFTVSPIRHAKDGMHSNQLSKATLLLAANQLCQESESCFYFPSYEIMMDELRDYRFYADDMLHPSPLAIDYIWEKFSECCFSESTKKIIKEWSVIQKGLEHRPFNPKSESYRLFLTQILLKINRFREKFPYFDLEKEIKQCQAQLNISASK